jgi:hypothetical protein
MSEHGGHVAMDLKGPENTLPMMAGEGQFGPIEMGGMFTVVKVRDDQRTNDFTDPGWYRYPKDKIARRVSKSPDFGEPVRRNPYGSPAQKPTSAPESMPDMPGMDHSGHGG